MKNKKIFRYINILLLSIFLGISTVKAEIKGVFFDSNEIIINTGTTENLKYQLEPGLDPSKIIWRSSKSEYATIENGKVKGISEGTTTITASINGYASQCVVKVVQVKGISLNKTNLNISTGTSETLIATLNPPNASTERLIWKSSNPNVATVQKGKVTALSPGTTTITVSLPGYATTCTVNVIDIVPLKKITINKTQITLQEKQTETLKVNYQPSNATNKGVTWKSSNLNVATVDSNGKVTAISPGTSTITVISTDGGIVEKCRVTVQALSKEVTSVTLNKKELSILSGDSETLKVTVNPNYAENKKVTWKSVDEDIATVDSNGKVTGIKPGKTEIKVISEDGNKEAICKVTIKSPTIKSITFESVEKTIYVGDTETLKTITEPQYSELEKPVWKSSNESIVIVNNGEITGLIPGESVITVSNEDESIIAAINIKVIKKPKEKLNIKIEGYNLNFDPNVKSYQLEIGKEESLQINTNVSKDKVTIQGNRKLKDGSLINIIIDDEEKVTYVIEIKKKGNYTIYFIVVISILLLINLIRILIKNKKKK